LYYVLNSESPLRAVPLYHNFCSQGRDQMETGDETEGTPGYLREPPPHQLGGDIGAGQGQGTGQTTTVEGACTSM